MQLVLKHTMTKIWMWQELRFYVFVSNFSHFQSLTWHFPPAQVKCNNNNNKRKAEKLSFYRIHIRTQISHSRWKVQRQRNWMWLTEILVSFGSPAVSQKTHRPVSWDGPKKCNYLPLNNTCIAVQLEAKVYGTVEPRFIRWKGILGAWTS